MTDHKLGRWLLVALAIVGLAVAAPVVSAHGDETAVDDAHPDNESDDDWAARMGAQMTDHLGPDGVEWMGAHTGVTADEPAQAYATTDHGDWTHGHATTDHVDGTDAHATTGPVDGTHSHATNGHDNDTHGHVDDTHDDGTDGHC